MHTESALWITFTSADYLGIPGKKFYSTGDFPDPQLSTYDNVDIRSRSGPAWIWGRDPDSPTRPIGYQGETRPHLVL